MPPEIVDLRMSVEAGRGRVTDMSKPVHSAFRAPDFLVGAVNADFLRTYAAQSLVLGTALFHVKHASVTAEGVIFTDGRLNTCNELNTDLAYVEHYHSGTCERFDRLNPVTVTDPVVLLTGPGHLVYGHWLVDFLPKLYLLSVAGYRFSRLRFLIPADTPAFALAWLDLLGIGPSQLLRYDRLADVVVCRQLIVPTALRFGSRASPLFRHAAAFLRRRAENRLFRRRSKSRRLFVSRSSNAVTLNNRTLLQREAFERQAQARGFEVVRPETLSIPDQVRLFASADVLCGEYGSGLHGSMFCRPGATVMAARDNGVALGFLQSGIDQTLGHANGYVIGAGTPQGDGSFSVDEADLALAFDWLHWRHHA